MHVLTRLHTALGQWGCSLELDEGELEPSPRGGDKIARYTRPQSQSLPVCVFRVVVAV